MEESLLHAIIGSDMLENVPGELLVQLPGDETVADGTDTDDARNSNQNALYIIPHGQVGYSILGDQDINGLADLIDLDGRINHQSKVCDTNTNDLNGVLDPKRIPHKDELV